MTADPLVCLLYASRRQAAPAVDIQDQTRDILIASISNNRKVALSGILLVHDDWFLQALEGPKEAVDETYARIKADPRHRDAALLGIHPAERRRFARWTMCAQVMSGADETILRRLVAERGFDPFRCTQSEALDLLTAVADIHHQLLTQQHAELLGEALSPH